MTWWRLLLVLAATLRISTGLAQEIVSVDALSGEPFGVAELTLRWPADEPECYWLANAVGVQAADDRVYFPVMLPRVPADSPATIFQGRPPAGVPRRISLLFLFQRKEPFTVQVPALGTTRIAIEPQENAARHRRLFQRWWREFTSSRQHELARSPGHDVVPSILARRFGLEIPGRSPPSARRPPSPSPLDLIFGTATDAAQPMTDGNGTERIAVSVPSATERTTDPRARNSGRRTEPEQIGEAIPAECFFAGCDTFSEMMDWLRYLEQRQRQIGPLIRLRGDDTAMSDRIRKQLGVLELPIPAEMADHFIGSIAVMGMDLNLADGAALGVVLQSKNPALGLGLVGLRNQIAMREPQATIKTISLHGTSVSLLATPDNRVRSYYVVRGNFHLVTNCQELASRFVQCDPSADSIASLPEFQTRIRSDNHGKRDLVCFVSTRFQQDLSRVDRWLEAQRRSAARRDAIELLVAGRLSEILDENDEWRFGDSSDRVKQLIELGWLPDDWGKRIDGSYALFRHDRVQDSLRGMVGCFLPVPDITVTDATRLELERHDHVQRFLDEKWGEPPPIFVRLSRTPDETNQSREVISVQLDLAPLRPPHHALLRQFVGEPTDVTMLPMEGLALGFEWLPPDRPLLGLRDRRLVIAIPDGEPPLAPPSNQLLAQLMAWRNLPLVIASHPDDSLLMRFDPVGRLRPIEEGETTRGALGMYRRRADGWYSISYDSRALDDVTQRIGRRPADRVGQARLILADPNQSRLANWIAAVTHDRLRRASLQSARAMNLITHDLRLQARDSQELTALLLGAEQQCPLGGEWQWIPVTSVAGGWIPSVRLVEEPPSRPPTSWRWLRELRASCELQQESFVVSAQWTGLATMAESP